MWADFNSFPIGNLYNLFFAFFIIHDIISGQDNYFPQD